jgi:hypothetical protein
MANRKKAEALCLSLLEELEGGTENVEVYKAFFKTLSDKEFKVWIDALDAGEEVLAFYTPNGRGRVLSVDRAIKLGEKLGVKFFERLWLTDPVTGERTLTPNAYSILDVTVRRQNQHLVKGISTAEHDRTVDNLTGQVTGVSKSAKLSLPELLQLQAKGMDSSILEMIKVRGGDEKAARYMKESVAQSGSFSVEGSKQLGSKPTITKALRALLLSVHFDNTIGEQ